MERRPQLVSLLDARTAEAVVLLVAPPGFGKTMLVADALPAVPVVRCLPEAGAEAFARSLLEAAVPGAVRALGQFFEGAHVHEPEFDARLAAWLAVRLGEVAALVVDDVHRLLPGGLALLERLVVATRERLRWTLASRETPALPVGSWIAYGWMALPITESELAFTLDEAASLAAEIGVAIERADVAEIVADTQGWPIGVRVALESWRRSPQHERVRPRTREVLFAHVEAEIWSRLDEAQRRLVIACALLGGPPVAVLEDAGVPDARAALERLHAAVPFVQRDARGEYVLHALFAEFAGEIARRRAADTAALGSALGTALRDRARAAAALDLFVGLRNAAEIETCLLADGFGLLDGGRRDLVSRSIAVLEAAGRGRVAAVTALRGAMALRDGNAETAELQLRRARAGAPAEMRFDIDQWLAAAYLNQGRLNDAAALLAEDDAGALAVAQRAQRRSVQARAAAMLGDADAARAAIAAAGDLLGDLDAAARARTGTNLGLALFYLSDFPAAAAFSREAADLAESVGLDAAAAPAYSVLYAIEAATGDDPNRQLEILLRLTAVAERGGNRAAQVYGLRAQALLAAERGDDDAFDAAYRATTSAPDTHGFKDRVSIRVAEALRHAGSENYRRAITVLRGSSIQGLHSSEIAYRDAHLALYLALDGRPEEARSALVAASISEPPVNVDHVRTMAWSEMISAVVCWELDHRVRARRIQSRRFGMLSPREARFATVVSRLVAIPRPMNSVGPLAEICAELLDAGFGGYARIFSQLGGIDEIVELSRAELQTLRAFETAGRVDDVAAVLGKSPNTIRNQLKSIFKKLGCAGRPEALAYARRRGWLSGRGSEYR